MSKLPAISGRDCVKTLAKTGFRLRRQEGSHIVLRRDDPYAQVVVPDHRESDRGTLRTIPPGAGVTVEVVHRAIGLNAGVRVIALFCLQLRLPILNKDDGFGSSLGCVHDEEEVFAIGSHVPAVIGTIRSASEANWNGEQGDGGSWPETGHGTT